MRNISRITAALFLAFTVFSCNSTPAPAEKDTDTTATVAAPVKPETYRVNVKFSDYSFAGNAVIACHDSGFILLGSRDENHPRDNRNVLEQLASAGSEIKTEQAALVRVDESGSVTWIKTFPADGMASSFAAMVPGNENTFYTVKNNYVNGYKCHGYELLHLDESGKELARWTFHTDEGFSVEKLARLGDGDFVVAGVHEGAPVKSSSSSVWSAGDESGKVSLTEPSFRNAYFAHIGSDGKTEWEKELASHYFEGMTVGPDGTVYITAAPRSGENNYFVAAFDGNSGQRKWKTKVNEARDFEYPLAVFPDSTVAVFTLDAKDGKAMTRMQRFSAAGKALGDTLLYITDDFTLNAALPVAGGILFSGADDDHKTFSSGVVKTDGSLAWIATTENCKTLFACVSCLSDGRLLFWMNRWDASSDKNFVTVVVTDEKGKVEQAPGNVQ